MDGELPECRLAMVCDNCDRVLKTIPDGLWVCPNCHSFWHGGFLGEGTKAEGIIAKEEEPDEWDE